MNFTTPVYFNYKDRVFRLLFKEKKRLLELYNALHNTNYTNEDDLTINTLENAIYIKMKNDISFVIDCNMCLYEHQSSFTPNMPLRGLLYFADLYKKLMKDTDLSVRKLVTIPTPHYIVFYNGLEKQDEEFILRLSDAFEDDSEGCMELTDAVNAAVDECINANILKDFLLEHKAEVVAMSIYEYNEEYVRKSLFEDGVETGYSKGYISGQKAGDTKGDSRRLVQSIEAIMANLNVNLKRSCEILGITPEEYEKAKQQI